MVIKSRKKQAKNLEFLSKKIYFFWIGWEKMSIKSKKIVVNYAQKTEKKFNFFVQTVRKMAFFEYSGKKDLTRRSYCNILVVC